MSVSLEVIHVFEGKQITSDNLYDSITYDRKKPIVGEKSVSWEAKSDGPIPSFGILAIPGKTVDMPMILYEYKLPTFTPPEWAEEWHDVASTMSQWNELPQTHLLEWKLATGLILHIQFQKRAVDPNYCSDTGEMYVYHPTQVQAYVR